MTCFARHTHSTPLLLIEMIQLILDYNELMRTWKLSAGDPLQLSLAADASLDPVDPSNHAIWELNLGQGDPSALAVQTTFGLRARRMQCFPCFTRLGKTRIDPATFHRPPSITHFYPNYIIIHFSPFEGVEVQADYWAAGPLVLAGKIEMANKSILPHNIRLELAGLLAPLTSGESMAALPMGLSTALQGQSAGLKVVCCLGGTAHPGKGTYPALSVQTELYPGGNHTTTWAVAAAADAEQAYELARAACNRSWDAELARIELHSLSNNLDIGCGIPDWDAAFALSTRAARGLLLSNPNQLPRPSFVLARRPDHGFSARGDGSDFPLLWRGQTGFDSYYLAGLLLPASANLARGLVENFLHSQADQGLADWRPGLGGQRSLLLAQPLVAVLALLGAPSPAQDDWLAVMYPALLQLFRTWLDENHDRDGDGFPEWSHPFQTAIDSSPLFDRWQVGTQGVDPATVESPALGAMLYRECLSLIEIARRAGKEEDLAWLSAQSVRLAGVVEETWDRKAGCYSYRDMQNHLSLAGRTLAETIGSGIFMVKGKLRAAQHLLVHLTSTGDATRAVTVSLHGLSDSGEKVEETLSPRDFTWSEGRGRATSRTCYLQVNRIEIQGLQSEDQAILRSVDLTQLDISLLLPLWAGIPNPKRAAILVQQQIMGGWLQTDGLPTCPPGQRPEQAGSLEWSALPWNALVIQGLLAYGYRTEAAELFTRLMNAVLASLKRERAFRQFYHAETGAGQGERDHLWGLVPVNLFLQIVGIEKITPSGLIVRDFNPFPWPVTVKYQRISIIREGERTVIHLPGRPPLTLTGREPRHIAFFGSEL